VKFVFLFPGKTREKYLDAGIRDYAGRLARYVGVELVVLKEKHSHRGPAEQIRRRDAQQLLARTGARGLVVALDPAGRQVDSEELAHLVTGWEDRGAREIFFLIGGHLGLHETVLRRADLVLALSRLTFTHEMSRLILLEQLYRAWTIKAGHNYHR